jgi:hypothetical protein
MHTEIHKKFGRLHENGSTGQEKAELTALPFFLIPYLAVWPPEPKWKMSASRVKI